MAKNVTLTSPPNSRHHCKDCGLYFESDKLLEVHFQYHKGNLNSNWITPAQNDLENDTKVNRDAHPAPPDDALMTKPSPEFQQRATLETSASFGHPETPPNYHSSPSPYQMPEQAEFSPGQFPQYGPPPFATDQQPAGLRKQTHYEYASHCPRFHPYGKPSDRSSHVSSTSPSYGQLSNQPMTSPSPKQSDTLICDSTAQLNEHYLLHLPTPQNHYRQQQQGYAPKHYPGFQAEAEIEPQVESADILDLDSQNVVHPGGEENGLFDHEQPQPHHNDPNSHSMSAMLSWPERYGYSHMNSDSVDREMYLDQKLQEPKMYHEQEIFTQQDQKLYQPHQMMGVYHSGPSSMRSDMMQEEPPSTRQDLHQDESTTCQPFDSPAGSQISSSQISSSQISSSQISSSQASNSTSGSVPPVSGRGANWKSNEARRPYNCTVCNKWFTTCGFLKRHYNSKLHKNAVRSSGQLDTATMPISNHHHKDQPLDSNPLANHHLFHQSFPLAMDNQPPGLESSHPPQGASTDQEFRPSLDQNFQQNLTPNHQNGMYPHVMDIASNITSTIGETHFFSEPKVSEPLPSFAQIQSQQYSIVQNFSSIHNVITPSKLVQIQSYVPVSESSCILSNMSIPKETTFQDCDEIDRKNQGIQVVPIKLASKQEMDDSNKENCEWQMKSTSTPITQIEYKNNGSPSIQSTVFDLPLHSSNKQASNTASAVIHKCFECDKLFNKACYLTQHNKSFHSGVKPFKCGRCGKRFSDNVSFEAHYVKHDGDKPWKCNLCPKQFNHKVDLRRHMYLHSGKMPFSCCECGKGFNRKDHLLKHCETHLKSKKTS